MRWLRRTLLAVPFATVAFALLMHASPRDSVRGELIRLQNQSGLTLISFEGSGPGGPVYVFDFASRSLPDRKLLKAEMGGVRAITPDGTKIAVELRREMGQVFSTPAGKMFPQYRTSLGIVRRDGSDFREYPDLDEPDDVCWSPDGSVLVLTAKNLKQARGAGRRLQIRKS